MSVLPLRSEGLLLANLVRKSRSTLFTIKSVFPFDFFPDILTIDENKVNVVKRYSWFRSEVHSALIEDISEVTVERGLVFATLKVVDSNNLRFPIELTIKKLKIDNAFKARRLIEGLIVAKREKVDLSNVEIRKVLSEIESIGKMKGIE